MTSKVFFLSAGMLMTTGLVLGQQKPFTINGTMEGKTNEFIYLSYTDESSSKSVNDSALIKDGSFSFKGKLAGVTEARVMMNKTSRENMKYLLLFLSPGTMQLSINYDDFSNGLLIGSPVQDEMNRLNKSKAEINARLKPLSAEYDKANKIYSAAVREKKDEATLQRLKDAATAAKDAMGPYQKQLAEKDRAFMDQHPASYATAYMLRYSISRMPLKEGLARYEKLSPEAKKSRLGKEIYEELEGLKSGSPGATAFAFASRELRGDMLRLADYKGKYVLVDFWASWCVPCRKGNPHLLSLYSKYKDKGFEIIGVSDDDSNPDAWKKAVEQDNIGVWKHVLRGLKRTPDGGFDRSASIADQYGIHSLPTKILINPQGVIIGRYGGGGENDEAMDKKLAEVFGA